MSKLVVELRIGDYAKWRSVFDKNKSLRDGQSKLSVASSCQRSRLTARHH
jgi:hypothetical protein